MIIDPGITIVDAHVEVGDDGRSTLYYHATWQLSDGSVHDQSSGPYVVLGAAHGHLAEHHEEIKSNYGGKHPTPHVEARLVARRDAAALLASGDHEGALRADALSALAELEGRLASQVARKSTIVVKKDV